DKKLKMKTYFSNRVEQLYDFFKKELYLNNAHPFAERLIVVPSPAVKNWLTLRLADDPDFGIAMGFKIGFLDQTLKSLTKDTYFQPSRLTIGFALESLLNQKIKKGTLDSQIQEYIGDTETRKGQRRVVQL